MKSFYEPLLKLDNFEAIRNSIKNKSTPIQITGCVDTQFSHLLSGINDGIRQKVIITFSEQKAKEIYDDYKFFDKNTFFYPAKDFIFYSAQMHGSLLIQQRMEVIKRLVNDEDITIITTLPAFMDKIMPLKRITDSVVRLEAGTKIDLENLKQQLVNFGYARRDQTQMPGEFSIRGSIVDIYTMTNELPYRIDLWDDEVDIIKTFEPQSQRAVENVNIIEIFPASEYILYKDEIDNGIKNIENDLYKSYGRLRTEFKTEEAHRLKTITNEFISQLQISRMDVTIDSYINYFFAETVGLCDYLSDEALIILDEPKRIVSQCRAVEEEFKQSIENRLEKGYMLSGQSDIMWSYKSIMELLQSKTLVAFTLLDQYVKEIEIKDKFYIECKNIESYNNNFELLVKDLERYRKQGYAILLLSASSTRAKRLAENLREFDLNAFFKEDFDREIVPGEIMVGHGNIHKGFKYPLIKYVVITETDIFGTKKKKRRKKHNLSGKNISSFSDLTVGDYVVHENHGLGIYKGIKKIEVDKIEKDYIVIEYAAGAKLYILATKLDSIQKYADKDSKKPKLNKLGSSEWGKTKNRVQKAVGEVAKDLVELYAKRQIREGYAYSEDTTWQKEFEELFPFEETADQLSAIEDVKRDMESKRIMDRIVCGDVGYGKTEIAIRAAFKAVQDNKQVAVLVPTTILAQQHFNTFSQRFKDFPVKVEMLSRFKSASKQNEIIKDLKKGFVDIVIGTHRVLSADVKFKDLGLLIIDEEQRFGVKQKEKIKQLKENVDVITLTATPIPRTMHMGLIGIRDMSVLEEPPQDRVPIQTYVTEYNEEMVREAINREISRGGQVYYVYNKVRGIDEIASKISELVPNAVVEYAHGQMSEHRLEQIMYDFINGEIDVLVSTTIIETGLDISNVNTMIIHNADNLGLSQLYQLRGRIGRSNRTAYAFLMYGRDKLLREIAEKRLNAIREFSEFGSGVKIAMRDLELRGAGNLLGEAQHGNMEAVGYDLYCKMLNEAVEVLKGLKSENKFETSVELDIDAFIPPTYIPNEYQKLDVYKRISNIENSEEYDDMVDELTDRFGEIPKKVESLLKVALLKADAHDAYVTELSGNKNRIKASLYEEAKIDVIKIPELVKKYNGMLKFLPAEGNSFIYTPRCVLKDSKEVVNETYRLINDLKALKE